MDLENDLLLPDELPFDHRSGFVAVVGRPNVGKSTLVNRLLGQKIAIVSPKPQTTRNRLLGILTRDDVQVIFTDTPGIHRPKHRLGEALLATATETIPDADAVLWVVDVSEGPTDEDHQVAEVLADLPSSVPVILSMNKMDRVSAARLQAQVDAYAALAPGAVWMLTSAIHGENLDRLLSLVREAMPLGPRLYPADQVTDQQARFMAAELVREQVLLKLRDEVPHSVAVLVNEFKPRSEEMTYISAVVYVERDSQKLIVLGASGQMLKRIGMAARRQIEALLDTRVYLDLWVKVRPKWRTKDQELRRLGYRPPRGEARKGGGRHRKRRTGQYQ